MKTMKTMKHFLSMAALALMGAMMTGCSNDDNIDNAQQPESKSKLETLTTTVSLCEDGTTRALTPGGVKTFAAGDQIAVVYTDTNNNKQKATSTALKTTDISNESKTATFTVTLSNPDKTKNVIYAYPASMIDDDGDMNIAALATQDGTFDTLESSLDFAAKAGDWNGEELPSVTLDNQLAILAITLKDAAGTNDITSTITGMTLSDGTDTYTVTREAAAGPIYVAFTPVNNSNVTITATDGTKNYFKSLTGKTYAANNGYDVSWRMYGVGDVILADGNFAARSTTTGTIVAMITYLGSSTGVEDYTHGLALALSDKGSMDWSTATGASGAAAHTPAAPTPITSSWMLPSKDQWNKMIDACKNVLGTKNNYQDLRDGFSGIAGASNLESSELFGYWSSTEYEGNSDFAWVFYFDGSGWVEHPKEIVDPLVLACLAF